MAQLQVGPTAPYTTIQSAVENARPGDEIVIAKAVYSESVNLARMGQAVNGTLGTISLITNDVDVIVNSPAGPAIHYLGTPANRFPGNITIRGLTLESPQQSASSDSDGVRVVGLVGNLSIVDSVFRSIADDSVFVQDLVGTATVRGNDFESVGNEATDRSVALDRIEGTAVVSENTFNNVYGTAMDLRVPVNTSMIAIVDENAVLGDGQALATTRTAIMAQVSGTADLSLVANQVTDLSSVGIKVSSLDNAALQARIHRNTLVTIGGDAGIQLDVRNQSVSAVSMASNVIDLSGHDGIQISAYDAARLDLQLLDNVLFLIGAGPNEHAISLISNTSAAGSVHASLTGNSITDVTGNGILAQVAAGGDIHLAMFDNFLTQTNSDGGTAAIVASTLASSTGVMTLQIRQNRQLDVPNGFALLQNGGPPMQLAGAEPTASAEITATNDGGTVTVTGQVNVVDATGLPSPPASIGNFVWRDLDGNSVQDGSEVGVGFVEFRISGTDEAGRSINRRTFSDANGEYFFSALIPGQYTLTVVPPVATALAAARQGDDSQFDSDFDPNTRQVTIPLTVDDVGIDVGIWSTYTNPRNSLDVNDDTFISPIDALLIINDLNANQSRALSLPPPPQGTPPFIDTNGDNFIAPIDALLVINAINAASQGEGETNRAENSQIRGRAVDEWFAQAPSFYTRRRGRRR